jgi:hypothetical protein
MNVYITTICDGPGESHNERFYVQIRNNELKTVAVARGIMCMIVSFKLNWNRSMFATIFS